ncbi:DUF4397 domain-containing protein [Catenulispora rubra]|uniref:DUF4397 domain-containing protein n=1 Tax=Catenulispora rubra TaxID=280293 RepID=UPI00189220F7|nr:DUF4397 domain-containing protein [Catenulispora rubra]
MLNRKIQAAAGTAVAALAAGMASGGTAEAAGSAQDGWVRLAHLSPNTPPVDVYLYAFGGTTAETVLKHVAYGTASSYEALPQGLYTVAMRAAGADSASAPVISTNVDVKSGSAYTVAGLGPSSGLTLSVLSDRLDAPAGKADVRVIEASLQNPSVTVSAGGQTIGDGLRFPTVTDYQTVAAGPWDVAVKSDAASTTAQVDLHTGSTYTLAILDGTGNAPQVLNLTDSAGSAVIPKGGVAAGYGGGTGSTGFFSAQEEELLWGGLLLVGAGGAGFAVRRLRRF